MSANASGHVWKHSRAKGSNLLALLAIADIADEQGRNAWPSAEHLAAKTRMTPRAMRLILHKLERDGELVIELNGDRRVVKHGYTPPYFLHIRCVFDVAYAATESEKITETAFARGRRPKGKVFPKAVDSNRQSFPRNGNAEVPELEKTGTAYKEDPLVDPLGDTESRAPTRHRRHVYCPRDGAAGFCVPAFLDAELQTMLGPHVEAFDLLGWYVETDIRRARDQPVVEQPLNWWREELRAVLRARGWIRDGRRPAPLTSAEFHCPHLPPCAARNECNVKTRIAAARAS